MSNISMQRGEAKSHKHSYGKPYYADDNDVIKTRVYDKENSKSDQELGTSEYFDLILTCQIKFLF